MKRIKAKFVCQSVRLIPRFFNGEFGEDAESTGLVTEEVHLSAVFDTEGSNRAWAVASPSGDLKMTIENPEAQKYFVPGNSYYLDISEADD